MTLKDYYFDQTTDKGWLHGYIECYYSDKFSPLREKPIIMLELGVYRGKSIQLWNGWFKNAFIYGIDVSEESIKKIENIPSVKGFLGDGYTMDMVNKFDDDFFDFIIEDGPHTLDSQIFAVKNWTRKLKKNGTLIIEDIQDISHVGILIGNIPSGYAYKSIDMRSVKNRYDDIILEITKF
jgi:SAM-dependent methyltransferase